MSNSLITIKGKSLITTDWHFGLKNNSLNRLKILSSVTKSVGLYMKENKIDNFIFMGDFFHQRNALCVNTIHVATSCLEKIAANCKNVYLILGNHDLFMRDSTDVNSMVIFHNIKNVTIIKSSTECDINGKHCLFAPWLGSLDFPENSFDMAFGHYDIPMKFLMQAYIEDHSSPTTTIDEIKDLIKRDEIFQDEDIDTIDEQVDNQFESYVNREKSSELLGDWIKIVKEGGTIFGGHIHGRSERYAAGRRFILVGSPYQQTMAEIKSVDGFYTLDEDNNCEFHELENIPRHINLRMSDIVRNVDAFNFDIVKGNIIHKIYDVEVDRATESKILQKIYLKNPFEELPPDYLVSSTHSGSPVESLEIAKRSKLDYLRLYIGTLDEKSLSDRNIDRDKLLNMVTEYYNRVTE